MGKILAKLSNRKVDLVDTVAYVFNRGVFPLLRFSFFRLTSFGKHKFPSFFGRGSRVMNTRYLRTGCNFYLGEYSRIDCLSLDGVNIGDNVTIREFAWLQLTSKLDNPGLSVTIGDSTYIGPRSIIGGAAPIIIGKKCQIGANVSFIAENHDFDGSEDISAQGVNRRGIHIGDDCWFGNNVTVLDGVHIGKSCVIGAGAVVTKSFPDHSVIVGVPAKLIRMRGHNEALIDE
jgi:acetyltransferase-like isoleucine patch superfamily enzyme